MNLCFIGFGELGNQLLSHINDVDCNNEIIYFDDNLLDSNKNNTYKFEDYININFSDSKYIIGLGYKHLNKKRQILNYLTEKKTNFFTFIHEKGFVNKSSKIGEGSFIYPNHNIDRNVTVGKCVIINNSVTISHDTVINDCVYISPGVIISGNVEIGECTFIGTGSIISNNVKIGKNVKIGIGSVITNDIPDGMSVIGNPMKIVNSLTIK